jgi:hypothetical protein
MEDPVNIQIVLVKKTGRQLLNHTSGLHIRIVSLDIYPGGAVPVRRERGRIAGGGDEREVGAFVPGVAGRGITYSECGRAVAVTDRGGAGDGRWISPVILFCHGWLIYCRNIIRVMFY